VTWTQTRLTKSRVYLIADGAKSVICGRIVCAKKGRARGAYGGKKSYQRRNGNMLLVCVHNGICVFRPGAPRCQTFTSRRLGTRAAACAPRFFKPIVSVTRSTLLGQRSKTPWAPDWKVCVPCSITARAFGAREHAIFLRSNTFEENVNSRQRDAVEK